MKNNVNVETSQIRFPESIKKTVMSLVILHSLVVRETVTTIIRHVV